MLRFVFIYGLAGQGRLARILSHQLGGDYKLEAKPMTDSLTFIEIMLAQSALQQSGYYHGPVDGNLNKSARQAPWAFRKTVVSK
jgi:hypothetical protein